MSSVGDQLRTAREAQKRDLRHVAEATKIRTDHLQALEAGDYSPFVAPVYIRGFVRTYATLLKLDVPKLMSALDEELAGTEKFREPPALTPARRGPLDLVMLQLSRINWRKAKLALVAIPFLVVILVAVYAWRHTQRSDPLAGLGPPVYQPTRPVSGDALPLPAPPAR